ncbi:hypothetical protein AZE42_13587, partial [Rhizopogon vesiculosus]
MVKFYVVLKTDLCQVNITVSDDTTISDIFDSLKSGSAIARRALGRTLYDQYQYYKLKNSVALPRSRYDHDEIVQTCLHRSNWEEVYPDYSLDVLAPTSARTVYMVIQPGDPTQAAIAGLEANHGDIFSCLQITVANLQRWTMEDVKNNLQGGRLWRSVNLPDYPVAIATIEQSLARRRTFNIPPEENSDLEHALEHDALFWA